MTKALLNVAIALNAGAVIYCGIGMIQTAKLLGNLNDPPTPASNKMAALAAISGVLLASLFLLVWYRIFLGKIERSQ